MLVYVCEGHYNTKLQTHNQHNTCELFVIYVNKVLLVPIKQNVDVRNIVRRILVFDELTPQNDNSECALTIHLQGLFYI